MMRYLEQPIAAVEGPARLPLASSRDDVVREDDVVAEDGELLEAAIACDHAIAVATYAARRVRQPAIESRLQGFRVDDAQATARTLELALRHVRAAGYRARHTTAIGWLVGVIRYWVGA